MPGFFSAKDDDPHQAARFSPYPESALIKLGEKAGTGEAAICGKASFTA
jgi:hypothetical protein